MVDVLNETRNSYQTFYNSLLNLREEFYRHGRIDDSNAKLDEITKLLIINYYETKLGSNRFNINKLQEIAQENFGSSENIALALHYLFEQIISDPMFINNDGTNIFGPNPSLNLQPTENDFAINLINEISKIDFTAIINNKSNYDFDIMNEFFGHFVRDNFRHNKEDGQYMTPQEIILPMLEMVLSDIFKDEQQRQNILMGNFKIADPTCGVSTLIIEALKALQNILEVNNIPFEKRENIISTIKSNGLIGQDKVDRMVRLSKINMLLFGGNLANIYHGNSILSGSKLDNLNESIDLIITNPPFGAVYTLEEVLKNQSLTILNSLDTEYENVDSELIMLDKCLGLLKPGGKMVIVVPDSVVSAKGIYGSFREKLLKICNIKAVIDLPSVTFAQAGTRTKCVILYLEKKKSENKIFFSICEDIGYDVKERKGVAVKFEKGINQMPLISKIYLENKLITSNDKILSTSPSCTFINQEKELNSNFLTPNFYKADRIKTITSINSLDQDKFDIKKLNELVDFDSIKRKRLHVNDEIKHVSVLHINYDNTINFKEVEKFEPVSKGKECFENEILFSKINPRIPRIAIVPNYDKKLVCSNEFEVLTVKDGINPYLIMVLLNSENVQNQIINLTSGTSSSHNRIKSEQLENVIIPFPKKDTELYNKFIELGNSIQKAILLKYDAENQMSAYKHFIESSL